MEQRITLSYAPRKVFKSYHDRTERFSCIVAHRRCGKTVACINDIGKRAIMLDKESQSILAAGRPDDIARSDDPRVRAFFTPRGSSTALGPNHGGT